MIITGWNRGEDVVPNQQAQVKGNQKIQVVAPVHLTAERAIF